MTMIAESTQVTSLPLRGAALAAGPTALVALALVLAAEASGDGTADIARTPLGVAASVAALLGLVCLAFALVGLRQRVDSLRVGAGSAGWSLALLGTILAAGGAWVQVFVLPGLAVAAPAVANSGLDTVLAGYLVSYGLLGLGWATVGISLLRARLVRGSAWLIVVGAVVCLAPPLLGVRWFLLAAGVSVVALRLRAR